MVSVFLFYFLGQVIIYLSFGIAHTHTHILFIFLFFFRISISNHQASVEFQQITN